MATRARAWVTSRRTQSQAAGRRAADPCFPLARRARASARAARRGACRSSGAPSPSCSNAHAATRRARDSIAQQRCPESLCHRRAPPASSAARGSAHRPRRRAVRTPARRDQPATASGAAGAARPCSPGPTRRVDASWRARKRPRRLRAGGDSSRSRPSGTRGLQRAWAIPSSPAPRHAAHRPGAGAAGRARRAESRTSRPRFAGA